MVGKLENNFTYAETANAATANVGVKDNNWIAGHAIHWAGALLLTPLIQTRLGHFW